MTIHRTKRTKTASDCGTVNADTEDRGGRRPGKIAARDSAGADADEPRSRIEPGQYEAICFDVKKCPSFGGDVKLVLRFRIQGGPHDGEEVAMFCNYYPGKSKPAHKLYQQWSLAHGRVPRKGERIAMKHFVHRLYLVEVRYTTSKDSAGMLKPDFLQYSVVDAIVEPQTGGVQ